MTTRKWRGREREDEQQSRESERATERGRERGREGERDKDGSREGRSLIKKIHIGFNISMFSIRKKNLLANRVRQSNTRTDIQ